MFLGRWKEERRAHKRQRASFHLQHPSSWEGHNWVRQEPQALDRLSLNKHREVDLWISGKWSLARSLARYLGRYSRTGHRRGWRAPRRKKKTNSKGRILSWMGSETWAEIPGWQREQWSGQIKPERRLWAQTRDSQQHKVRKPSAVACPCRPGGGDC